MHARLSGKATFDLASQGTYRLERDRLTMTHDALKAATDDGTPVERSGDADAPIVVVFLDPYLENGELVAKDARRGARVVLRRQGGPAQPSPTSRG